MARAHVQRLARREDPPAPARKVRPRPAPAAFDRIIHDRMRLGIVGALAVNESLAFTDLRDLIGATDGNLSVHARRLEDAGYVSCAKTFEGRMPRTVFTLTPAGRVALTRYLDHMEALIKAVKR